MMENSGRPSATSAVPADVRPGGDKTPPEAAFVWKGWKWTFTMLAISVGHAVLWAIVWQFVYMGFVAIGLVKR